MASRTSAHVADRGGVASPGQLASAWLSAGGSKKDVPIAVAVALAESGGRITATNNNTNGSTDYGAWQVNSIHGYPASQLLTLSGNAKAAVAVKAKQGWAAWVTFNTGAYKKFAKEAVSSGVSGAVADAPGQPSQDILKGAAGAVGKALNPLDGLVTALGDPDTWKRVGLIVAGAIAMLLGVYFFGREFAVGQVGGIAKSILKTKK